jgi:short subunit dehydrogenase-like uncharacterized protein
VLQCGVDSVPSDILTYILVKHIRSTYNEGLTSVISTVQSVRGGISGGTAASAMNISSAYPTAYLLKTLAPYSLSPVKPQKSQLRSVPPASLTSTLFGYWNVPDLGLLIQWPATSIDRAIVHRSWGLFDGGEWYGKDFRFAALLRAQNAFAGALQHYGLTLLQILMLLPPGRWLLRKWLSEPGQGPDRDDSKNFFMKLKAIATTESGRRVVATMDMMDCMYYFTGVFVAEAALTILSGKGGKAVREGGVVTSACLEGGYVDRLSKAEKLKFGVVGELEGRAKL